MKTKSKILICGLVGTIVAGTLLSMSQLAASRNQEIRIQALQAEQCPEAIASQSSQQIRAIITACVDGAKDLKNPGGPILPLGEEFLGGGDYPANRLARVNLWIKEIQKIQTNTGIQEIGKARGWSKAWASLAAYVVIGSVLFLLIVVANELQES